MADLLFLNGAMLLAKYKLLEEWQKGKDLWKIFINIFPVQYSAKFHGFIFEQKSNAIISHSYSISIFETFQLFEIRNFSQRFRLSNRN
jgi:hypothetical protein